MAKINETKATAVRLRKDFWPDFTLKIREQKNKDKDNEFSAQKLFERCAEKFVEDPEKVLKFLFED